MESVEALALVGGYVDEELLIRNEYLAAENEILKSKLEKPVKFNNAERIRLAKIAKRMSKKALKEVANIVRPDKWHGSIMNFLTGTFVIERAMHNHVNSTTLFYL